jgi:hypothetical protein
VCISKTLIVLKAIIEWLALLFHIRKVPGSVSACKLNVQSEVHAIYVSPSGQML